MGGADKNCTLLLTRGRNLVILRFCAAGVLRLIILNILYLSQIVKGIDAVTREQLVQVMAVLGVGNAAPVFSIVPSFGPIKPAAFLPTITEEDRVILNNVQKVAEFLTAGGSISRASYQVCYFRVFI